MTSQDSDHDLILPENEFPNAIDPQEWYDYPPIAAGKPREFRDTRLGSLDVSVRLDILDYVKCCISTWNLCEVQPRRKKGEAPAARRIRFEFTDILKGALGTSRQLRKEALTLLNTTAFNYLERNALMKSPKQLGDRMLSIRYLQLCTDRGLKWYHEGCFPDLLDFLCNQLPNLTRFQLKSRYCIRDDLLEGGGKPADLPGTTIHQQEVRALLRFGAFLVNKHKHMDLLLWPADSGRNPCKVYSNPPYECYIDVVANSLRFKRELKDDWQEEQEETGIVLKVWIFSRLFTMY